MLKQRLWLAVVGLAAGAILAYVQTYKSAPAPAPAPKLPPATAVDLPAPTAPPPLPAAEPWVPPAAMSTAPAAPAEVSEQPPVAPSPTPATSITPAAPYSSEMWPGFFVADSPLWATPPLPDDGKLWTKSIYLEANPSSAGGKLSFINKKTDAEPVSGLTYANMSSDVGTQYPLIKNGDTTFLGRVAGGFSRDYTGLAEGQHIPEVFLGCQVEHQITQRHKILGAVEYAHDVTDFGRRRIRTLAAWEVLLDADKNVSLRTGVLESSNKTPTGEQATNLNYTVDLIWKF